MTEQEAIMTPGQALSEAERCLQCFDAPCTRLCPVHIQIPTFIGMIRSGNIRGAAEVVKTSNAMANVCGKVCPEEMYCQSVCTRAKEDAPIRIRELHYYATQVEAKSGYSAASIAPSIDKTVAVVGGGPAGLGCAFELAKMGYKVTVFDKRAPGGVPANSIPPFRLTSNDIQDDVKFLKKHIVVRKETITAEKFKAIKRSFDAVFLGVGLGQDKPIEIPGAHLARVYPVLTFLENFRRQRKSAIGKKVVVIGGGNVSLDAASAAMSLGAAEVILLYRRSVKEMKVWKNELEQARARGVEFRFLTSPVEILGRTKVTGVKCRSNYLAKKRDGSGRPIPMEIAGSDFTINTDSVIVAIGQFLDPAGFNGIMRNANGFLEVNSSYQTTHKGIFAGGDAIFGEGTIVQSVAHGREAAWEIDEYLHGPKRRRAAMKQLSQMN